MLKRLNALINQAFLSMVCFKILSATIYRRILLSGFRPSKVLPKAAYSQTELLRYPIHRKSLRHTQFICLILITYNAVIFGEIYLNFFMKSPYFALSRSKLFLDELFLDKNRISYRFVEK